MRSPPSARPSATPGGPRTSDPRSCLSCRSSSRALRGSRRSAMPLELWFAYVVLCFLFAVTPGPAVLLTGSQAIARGFGAGFAVVLGTQLGNLIYFIVSAAGLGAILMASETAFMIVKYAGAAYLIFLGIRTILNARRALDPAEERKVPAWRHPFTLGLL